jgi:hypothetical protein
VKETAVPKTSESVARALNYVVQAARDDGYRVGLEDGDVPSAKLLFPYAGAWLDGYRQGVRDRKEALATLRLEPLRSIVRAAQRRAG